MRSGNVWVFSKQIWDVGTNDGTTLKSLISY